MLFDQSKTYFKKQGNRNFFSERKFQYAFNFKKFILSLKIMAYRAHFRKKKEKRFFVTVVFYIM